MINKEKRKNSLLSLLFLMPCISFSQTINSGELYISPGTSISTLGALDNKATGHLVNDGELYVYNDYNNDGLVTFTMGSTTGITRMKGQSGFQKISGVLPMKMYDVEFNNGSSVQPAFHLSNEVSISGTADFYQGIVNDVDYNGLLVFEKTALFINASDDSYVDGSVRKNGKIAFRYPLGDGGKYRYASISAPNQVEDAFSGKYFLENPDSFYSVTSKETGISLIDNKEYWRMEKTLGNSNVFLTLSWDESTSPTAIYAAPYDEIHIVRWDEAKKSWVDQGGVANFDTKEVVTVTNPLTDYGVFTLARVKNSGALIDIKTPFGISPNRDGLNDSFVIDGLDGYPDNRVTIINRYGVTVFETTSYNTNGNIFKGYSNENKNEVLPLGTYFYFVDYLDKASGVRMKKSGYLYINLK